MAATCSRVSMLSLGRLLLAVDSRCAGIACKWMSTREAPVLHKLNVEFSDERVQGLLRRLAGMDLSKVFRRRREELEVPKYQLMTDKQLKQVIIAWCVCLRVFGVHAHVACLLCCLLVWDK